MNWFVLILPVTWSAGIVLCVWLLRGSLSRRGVRQVSVRRLLGTVLIVGACIGAQQSRYLQGYCAAGEFLTEVRDWQPGSSSWSPSHYAVLRYGKEAMPHLIAGLDALDPAQCRVVVRALEQIAYFPTPACPDQMKSSSTAARWWQEWWSVNCNATEEYWARSAATRVLADLDREPTSFADYSQRRHMIQTIFGDVPRAALSQTPWTGLSALLAESYGCEIAAIPTHSRFCRETRQIVAVRQ